MIFYSKEYLLLLIVLIVLIFLLHTYNKKFQQKINLFSKKKSHYFLIKGYILIASMFFIIISLSRPLGNLKDVKYITGNKEIVITLDISSSMKAEDIYSEDSFTQISRFEAAKILINDLIEKLKDDVSLSVFSDNYIPLTPLTQDYELIKSFLNNIDIENISGGTNIYLAISESIKRFSNSDKEKIIILISDGENNSDFKIELPKNIKIITIGIGSKFGAKIPEGINIFGGKEYKTYLGRYIITELNEDTLKEIAKAGNGKYYFFENKNISKEIINYISSIKNTNIEKEASLRNEIFFVFLIISFLLLLL
ncbi:MAG: BatB protein [Candidatus Sericytochromatia bacterium]|nr:MAG: BatB protein [Candidatus Sericytochromatia bacterium]